MTIVVELRDLKNSLPRPITRFVQRAFEVSYVFRVRLACLSLLGIALGDPFDGSLAPRDGVLGMLCAVLTAVVSAATSLLCAASSMLLGSFSDHANTAFRLEQKLGLCFPEPTSPFDLCPAAGALPPFSVHRVCALAACAVILFGGGLGRRNSSHPCAGR